MTAHLARRGFLRGLATLPLIGGAVSIIGAPVRADVPVTVELLEAYNQWLFFERRLLCREAYPRASREAERMVPVCRGPMEFHFPTEVRSWTDVPLPSSRAAAVLSAVGCDWRRA